MNKCPKCSTEFSEDLAGGLCPACLLQQGLESHAGVTGESLTSSAGDEATATVGFPAGPLREGPGTTIGRYKLLQLIGEGGFGSVFMAEQARPVHRKVALKIIKLGMDTRAIIARFEAERQALAMMDHPHIARVLDAGATETGRPYFVMELVKGHPITEYCDANHLSVSERLDLFMQVCRAVQHAHQRGIIHRDIKPGNVLVSTQEGRAFAKVIDFGVAKALADRLTEKTLFTEFDQFIGTPAYMSPEQAAGTLDIDTRTDVYSLGALLYELLTGSAPFDARELRSAAYEEMRRIIREVEPPKPSTRLSQSMQTLSSVASNRHTEPKRLGGLVRGELDWIVMKALEKDRARRYESANELAADISRHSAGEPVIAAPPTAFYRLRKLAGRHKAALAMVAAIFVVLIAGAWVSTWQAVRASRALTVAETKTIQADIARAQAVKAQANEVEQTRLAKRQLADGLVSQGDALRLSGQTLKAHDRLVQSRSLYQELGLPVMAADMGLFNLAIVSPPALMTYSVNTRSVTWSVAFSPDGRTVLSGSLDGTLKLWDIATGKELRKFPGHASGVIGVAFSPDGHTAVSGGYDRALKRWDIATGKELGTVTVQSSSMLHMALSPNGQMALCAGDDGVMRLIDVATGTELRRFSGHPGGMESVAFSLDGRTALSGNDNPVGALTLWDIATGKELRTFSGHSHLVISVAFSPDGRTALSGSGDKTLKLWDIATGKEIRTFSGHTDTVESVAFSPDGGTALSSSDDDTLKLWDIATGMELRTFSGHSGFVHSAVFSPDGRMAFSGSNDKTLKLWDLSAGKEVRTFLGQGGSVQSVAISPDGRMALSGNQDKTVKLWDIATGRKLRTFSGHTDAVEAVAFAPDGRIALSGSNDKTLKLWDLSTGKELRTFSGHADAVHGVAITPDGRTALSGSDDGTLRLWDIATGTEIRRFSGHIDFVTSVAFSPDGRTALSGSYDATMKLWDVSTGKELHTFSGHGTIVKSVAFSPDGRTALSGSDDRTLKLWNIVTGKEIRTFSGHEGFVQSVVFSRDGRTAFSGSQDGTLKLWDIASGEGIRTFSGHTGNVLSVALAPDGGSALSAGEAGTLKLWDFGRADTYCDLEPKVEAAQQSFQVNPRDPSALAAMGQWYAFRGIDDWAIELLEKARAGGVSVSPLMLGRCDWDLNRYADARREYNAALAASNDPREQAYLQACIQAIDAAASTPAATQP